MRRFCSKVLAGITLLAFTGCAVVRPVQDFEPAAIRQQVRPGDVVHARITDGRSFELKVDTLDAESLTGTTVDGRRFRIDYASIAERQVRDPGQAAAGIGLLVLGALAFVGVLLGGFE